MKNNNQRGMTMIGMIFVLLVIGFFAVLVIRLWPIYYENFGVQRAVKRLAAEPGASSFSDLKIWQTLTRQLLIDQVTSVTQKDVVIGKSSDGLKEVHITYEVRKPIVFNIDVIVYFDDVAVLQK